MLHIKGLNEKAITTLSIIDMNGKISGTARITANNYNWNVSNLKAGTYYILIHQKENNKTLQFVKE